jgi:glycosyltransferase involved in cell wall biosynthesis
LKIAVFEAYPFFSGSQRITLNVCKILKEQGHHITLFFADDQFGLIRENFEKHVDLIQRIKTPSILKKYGNEDSWFNRKTFIKSIFLGLLPFYFRSFQLINRGGFDFLYCCDPRGATMMLFSAIFFRKKTVLHFHGKNRLSAFVANLYLQVFDKTICVSQDVYHSLPVSNKKVVILNGIDFSQYENINSVAIKDFISGSFDDFVSPLTFFYAGAIRPHKGLHHIVRAFSVILNELKSENKSALLFISGMAKSPEEINFKHKLAEEISRFQIQDYVIWLGWNNNVLGWMKSCDYFLFGSINKEINSFAGFGENIESSEGLPTVLIESSLCHLFSIASDTTGVKEIIRHLDNGIIYDGTKEGLQIAMREAVKDKLKFTKFSNKQEFSLESFKQNLLKVIVE